MIEIYPNYYKKFKCIANKCKNSCCIGWEIDIDDDTMNFYNSLDTEFSNKILTNIEGNPPHFVLKENERCPFLNQNGLCDIICNLGEGALCDICSLHPRFSNFYDDFKETGLGLCCEEAARIILTENERFSVSLPDVAVNNEFFKERKDVFDILQNREVTVLERLKKLALKCGYKFEFSNKELYDFYISLERLDKGWENELEKLRCADGTEVFEREDLQIFFEQLSCYFVFRHFDKGIDFMFLSCYVIGMICSKCKSLAKMIDIVRMYSCEIEYSEENTEKVAAYLYKN